MKIIPAIDLMDGKVVRLYKGDPKNKTIYSENPIEMAKKWESAGADILHIVDLDATLGRGQNLKTIHEISKNISVPLQVAGGLRSEEKISEVLEFASRVVIGTIAMQLKESEQHNILGDFVDTFGNDRIVISIDHIDGKIVTHGWQTNTGIDLYDATNELCQIRIY
jgi:Phosphoribosylformimino-5-aminoimidazole carboxamide ribonucleotide (ProFAR) isomerase